jgi:hypothetical protein
MLPAVTDLKALHADSHNAPLTCPAVRSQKKWHARPRVPPSLEGILSRHIEELQRVPDN